MYSTPILAAARRTTASVSLRASRLLLKAYAIALQGHLTTHDHLDRSSKAIFVASPGLYDLPAGRFAPQEITNDRLYRYADPMQDGRSPFYSSDGDSYFEFCHKYLKNIRNDIVSTSTLRGEVEMAQKRSAEAYLKDLDLYSKTADISPARHLDFDAWSARFGVFYSWAKTEQDRAESQYTLASTKVSGGISLALAAFNLAKDELNSRLGNNMPCTSTDMSSSVAGETPSTKISQDLIYYRPLYSVVGIDRRVDSWVAGGDKSSETVDIELDLKAARNIPWSSLGFPHLDQDLGYDTSNADFSSLLDFEISLKASGLQAFDIDRGFWDINAATRPSILPGGEASDKSIKTTRILLAYKSELRIKSKKASSKTQFSTALESSNGEANGILGIPASDYSWSQDSDGAVIAAGGLTGFPAILAVLGRTI